MYYQRSPNMANLIDRLDMYIEDQETLPATIPSATPVDQQPVEEDRQPDIQYTTVNASGKPTEDYDKIVKVIANLKSHNAGKTTKLAKEFETMLQQKKAIDTDLEKLKDKSREVFDELYSSSDLIWTRVLETAKVTISLSRDTVQKKINFNAEMFIDKILAIAPELTAQIVLLQKECTSEKVSNKKSVVDVKLKDQEKAESVQTESVHNFFKDAMKYVTKIKNQVMSWVKGYDKKLDTIEKQLDKYLVKGTNTAEVAATEATEAIQPAIQPQATVDVESPTITQTEAYLIKCSNKFV